MPEGGESLALEAFKISKSVSNADWGGIDKARLWKLLKEGLDEGADGVAEAVRQVYAAVRAAVDKDLTEAATYGPHHEIRDDGTVVLNRGGMMACAGALAGARSEPKLTDKQLEEARQHIAGHYREMGMKMPESLAGEITVLEARVTGEIRPDDIPLAPGIDLAALKFGDSEPMEVVVEIPTGKSSRGWNYRGESLQDIVNHVNQHSLNGFLGHQDPEKVDNEFPTPVTHWVGASWREGKAYFRGVVDKVAGDLKRWIRAGRVKQVSIFGIPKIETVGGETHVVGYRPFSIDWTPLDRAGMPTRIVAIGEMDSTFNSTGGGQKPMTWKELVAQLRTMLAGKDVTVGQLAGEMGWNVQALAGELDGAWLKQVTGALEAIGKVREALGIAAEVDVVKAVGEMSATLAKTREALGLNADADPVKAATDVSAVLQKTREALKVTGEMDVVKAAEDAKKAFDTQKVAEHDKAVGEMLAGKLTSDAIKKDVQNPETQLGKLWAYHKARIPAGMAQDKIAGEIDGFLGDKVVKDLISKYHTDGPALVGPAGNGGSGNHSTSLRVKRQSI